MRIKFMAIDNRLCGAPNTSNISKNNMVSLTQAEKGKWGPRSMGQIGAETHLGTIRVPTDLQYCANEMQTKFAEICEITRISAIKLRTFVSDEQMPNNPGHKGHWGNESVILPRPVKTKGIHPVRVRIPETREESK